MSNMYSNCSIEASNFHLASILPPQTFQNIIIPSKPPLAKYFGGIEHKAETSSVWLSKISLLLGNLR